MRIHLLVDLPAMKPSKVSINRLKKSYRKLSEEHPDPMVQRIAQGMETALIWATEDTDNWVMKDEPIELAKCLYLDLRR